MDEGLFLCKYFLLAKATVLPIPSPEIPNIGSLEWKGVFTQGKGSCKVQVSYLSLERTMSDVQKMALMDKLLSLSYSGGEKFDKMVRTHNQNDNNWITKVRLLPSLPFNTFGYFLSKPFRQKRKPVSKQS